MTTGDVRQPGEIGDASLRLALAPGLGPVSLSRLRTWFGDDDGIASASAAAIGRVPGFGPKTGPALWAALRDADPDGERVRMERVGAGLLLLGDDAYPPLLAAIPNPPIALWVRGELRDEDRLSLGVVGSRRCTAYGRTQADRLAALLGQCGLTITSGGARGIDAAAHRGALRAGTRTVAVLGCGLARSYPPEHARLFEEIVAAGGALLSELPMDAPPRAKHFPRRNRIISGLSLGVLVIEAAARGGALITAREAAEQQGREVMVLPGRVDCRASRGGLEAVRDGWAGLVLDHIDVLRQLDSSRHLVRGALEQATVPSAASSRAASTSPSSSSSPAVTPFVQRLNAVQGSIVEVLRAESGGATPIEVLSAKTGQSVQRVLAELTVLQIMGLARRDDDGVVLADEGGA